MSNSHSPSPDEVYYDAIAGKDVRESATGGESQGDGQHAHQSQTNESEADDQDAQSGNAVGGTEHFEKESKGVYFELEGEQDLPNDGHGSHNDSWEEDCFSEEEMSKEDKFKTAKTNFKKMRKIVKSKINNLGKGKLFDGDKKKTDAKRKELSRSESQPDANTEPLYDVALSYNPSNTSGVVTQGASMMPVGEKASSTVNTSPPNTSVIVGGATASATSPLSPTMYDSYWPENTSSSKAKASVYEFAQVIPQEPDNVVAPDSQAAEQFQTSGHHYDVPSELINSGIYSTVADALEPASPSAMATHEVEMKGEKDQRHSASREKLDYSSGQVPDQGLLGFAPTGKTDSHKSGVSSVSLSANKGCQEGVGEAVPVDFINPRKSPGREDEKSEYSKIYFRSTETRSDSHRRQLKERGYGSLASIKSTLSSKSSRQSFDQDENSDSENEANLSFDWGSEFDDDYSYQEEAGELLSEVGGYDKDEAPDKPLPPKPGKTRAFLPKPNRQNQVGIMAEDDHMYTACLPVNINPEKHPPPVLPPQPQGLSSNQKKRRMIIEQIISSERSYLESLERIVKEYEKPVLEFISNPKAHVRPVFLEMKAIVSHHKMFQIELAECIKEWDKKEEIGNVFTASFSKTMLVNAYSVYVNNFAAAMEEIRAMQRNRQAFDEFLKKMQKLSLDRLSIFGLMVKPVQRFPQFIMFLQDLIKYTPQDHQDRHALQHALTELENVAYKLNERKRHSEQLFQAHQTVQQVMKQKVQHMLTAWNLDLDSKRKLLRCDEVEQVNGDFGNMKCKKRRLILMNDVVMCVKVLEKEQAGHRMEKLILRWVAKLRDLELKDQAVTYDMQSLIKKEPGKIHIIPSQIEKPEEDPFHLYADLDEMLHDNIVLQQISTLMNSLKRSYASHELKKELVDEIALDLQRMIRIKGEQLQLVNSCSIILVDNSRSERPHYVLQTKTAAIKQDWCVDFLMAKLAMDKSNNSAWDGTVNSEDMNFDVIPAHFMKYLPVDVPRHYTKIRCAVSIFLNPANSSFGMGIQHLWVCSSTSERGQVSVISIHNSKPALIESFRACDCDIMAVELVPGCGEATTPGEYLFVEDTVWMATAHSEIFIFSVTNVDGVRRDPLAVVRTPAVTMAIKFVDERLFCGFDDGAMVVYSRDAAGAWNISHPTSLTFGTSPVKLHFIHEEDIWLSCGNKLCVVEIDSMKTKETYMLNTNLDSPIDEVVKSGVGIWVSFHDSSFIKLFHVETMENLQEISVGNCINRVRNEKLWTLSGAVENLVVTCLAVSKGLLWIGTSVGVVVTVPLPRLSDGVPLYRGRPSVSLHAHRKTVKFLIPLQCATSTLEMNKSSSLRSTLRTRPSKRNLEREQLELEESERRRDASKKSEASKSETNAENRPSLDTHELEDGKEATPVNANMKEEKNFGDLSACAPLSASVADITRRIHVDNNQSRRASDDSVAMRRSNSNRGRLSDRKSKTLSFRSELAQRIQVQSECMSLSDQDLTSDEPHEVEVLYEVLLEDEPGTALGEEERNTSNNTNPGGVGENNETGSATPKPSSLPHPSTPSWLRKKHVSVSPGKGKQLQVSKQNTEDVYSLGTASVTLSPSSASSSSSGSNNQEKDLELPGKSDTIKSLLRGRTTRAGTTRKQTSNAVIVLSGGDGYCDLDPSRNQSKTEDASVMLWIYKY